MVHHMKIKQAALTAFLDLENIMTLVFSGFSFILHSAHHQVVGSF